MILRHFGEETDNSLVCSFDSKRFGEFYFSYERSSGQLLIVGKRREGEYAEIAVEIDQIDHLIEILEEARELMKGRQQNANSPLIKLR